MNRACAGSPPARILLVGGSPDGVTTDTLLRAAEGADAVVAVDRGLDAALGSGLRVDLFCGDADSVSAAGRALVDDALGRAASGAPGSPAAFEVERYDPHKDFTDLSLALRAVASRWGGGARLVASGFSGGHPDHLLGVFGRLVEWPGAVCLVEDGFRGRVLRGGESWNPVGSEAAFSAGSRFSFVPLSAGGAVVSERGMRWELDAERVGLLSDLGISNVIERADARIECLDGAVAAWVFQGVAHGEPPAE